MLPGTETYAVQDGRLLAQQKGRNKLIFQSDCEAVVQTMINGGFSATAGTNIFQDCALMAQGIPFVLPAPPCPRFPLLPPPGETCVANNGRGGLLPSSVGIDLSIYRGGTISGLLRVHGHEQGGNEEDDGEEERLGDRHGWMGG